MKKKVKYLILLNFLFLIYSFVSVFSKFAGQYEVFSGEFILNYFLVLFFLFIYAIGWQQILKNIPLTVAYANKAVTTIWGLLWGCIFFSEKITLMKIVGLVIVVIGIILFSKDVPLEDHKER